MTCLLAGKQMSVLCRLVALDTKDGVMCLSAPTATAHPAAGGPAARRGQAEAKLFKAMLSHRLLVTRSCRYPTRLPRKIAGGRNKRAKPG